MRFPGVTLRLAAAAALACALAAPPGARASAGYEDRDASPLAAGTPDISAVAVGNDDASVWIVVTFAGAMPSGTVLATYLDTDANQSTGSADAGGADLLLQYDTAANEFSVFRWDTGQQDYLPLAGTGTRLALAAGSPTWLVPRSLLAEGASSFDFWVVAAVDTPSGPLLDAAPEASLWRYDLEQAADPDKLELAPGRAAAQHPAKAGSSWSASFHVVRSDSGEELGAEGHVSCRASVGGKTVRVDHASFVSTGKGIFRTTAAVCRWRLPTSARGKSLHAVITTTFRGATASRAFTTRVT